MAVSRRTPFFLVAGLALVASAVVIALVGVGGGSGKSKYPCGLSDCQASATRSPARAFEGAYVAADPSNPSHVVIADTDLTGAKCTWHTTFDGGKTWIDGAFSLPTGFTGCRLDAPSGGQVPSGSVAIGVHGEVYAVFAAAKTPDAGRESLLLTTSLDGGRTFLPARVFASPPAGYALARPLMTLSLGGSGQDVLNVSAQGCHQVTRGVLCDQALFTSSNDAGTNFTPMVVVDQAPGGQNPSAPVRGADGTIYETYQQRGSGEVDLFLAKSTNGGAGWTSSKIDSDAGIGVAYDPAKLAIAPRTGKLYAVWSDSRTGSQQIYFRSSPDGGKTWAEALQLTPEANYTGSSRNPSLGVAPDGRVDVAYYSTPPGMPELDQVYLESSSDGGGSFSPRLVNPQPIDRSIGYSGPAGSLGRVGNFYPPEVSSLDGATYVVWSDTAGSTPTNPVQDVEMRTMFPVASLGG